MCKTGHADGPTGWELKGARLNALRAFKTEHP